MKMRSWLVSLALFCAVGLVPGCGTAPDDEKDRAGDRESRLVAAALAVVDDPLRSAEDRARDANRKPGEVLGFFGISEGMRVVDLQAGTGYYTELLSAVVGPEGSVTAQNNDFVVNRFADGPMNERIARIAEAGRKARGTPAPDTAPPRRSSRNRAESPGRRRGPAGPA